MQQEPNSVGQIMVNFQIVTSSYMGYHCAKIILLWAPKPKKTYLLLKNLKVWYDSTMICESHKNHVCAGNGCLKMFGWVSGNLHFNPTIAEGMIPLFVLDVNRDRLVMICQRSLQILEAVVAEINICIAITSYVHFAFRLLYRLN